MEGFTHRFWKQKLAGQLDFCGIEGKIAEKATLFLNQKRPTATQGSIYIELMAILCGDYRPQAAVC